MVTASSPAPRLAKSGKPLALPRLRPVGGSAAIGGPVLRGHAQATCAVEPGRMHLVVITGALDLRILRIFTALIALGLDTTTVIVTPTFSGFLMNFFRSTEPKAFVFTKPLPFSPLGQPEPLQVTVTVAPSGTLRTFRL